MWDDPGSLAGPTSGRSAARGPGFELERREGAGNWLVRMWGAFPAAWCGNFSLNCAGAGLSILEGEARRLASGRWIAFFGLRATNPVAQPPALDLLRMAHRRPALRIADADVVLDEVSLGPAEAPRKGGLVVRVGGPDRLGLLAFLLDRFAGFDLRPSRIEVNTRSGRARDRFWLDAPAGRPVSQATRAALASSLHALRRPV